MNYLKNAYRNMKQFAQGIITEEQIPLILQLYSQIKNNDNSIIPLYLLEKISQQSFQFDNYQMLITKIFQQISIFELNQRYISRVNKIFVLINYLLKHGPSAFIDDFRQKIEELKNYQSLDQLAKVQKHIGIDIRDQIILLSNKAKHIVMLLQDKNKLLKQKEMSIIVKRNLDKKVLIIDSQLIPKKKGKGLYSRIINAIQKIDIKIDQIDDWIDKQLEKILALKSQQINIIQPIVSNYDL